MHCMEEIRRSNTPVVTEIVIQNKSRARYYDSLKPGSKMKDLKIEK